MMHLEIRSTLSNANRILILGFLISSFYGTALRKTGDTFSVVKGSKMNFYVIIFRTSILKTKKQKFN